MTAKAAIAAPVDSIIVDLGRNHTKSKMTTKRRSRKREIVVKMAQDLIFRG
jgi:hypothetical protein